MHAPALKHIAEIIERACASTPSCRRLEQHVDVRCPVGNSHGAQGDAASPTPTTAHLEAFNLKAAIEFQMKNFDAAKEASTCRRAPRQSIDPVSLHNSPR